MTNEHVIRRALLKLGAGTFDTLAVANASVVDDPLRYPSLNTVQSMGRKKTKGGAWVLSRQFEATYNRGAFVVSERTGYAPIPPPVAPEWFELPGGALASKDRNCSFDTGQRRERVWRFVEMCKEGEIALAPWQRPAVWSEDQQIALLDSMMRGVDIGALTMWHRRHDETTQGRALPGCAEPRADARLVVDGQQRTLALLHAASGGLDHWRWDGQQWTRGKGFLLPSMAVNGTVASEKWFEWHGLVRDCAHLNTMYKHAQAIESTEVSMMVLGGTAAEMIETYRRLATHGSPHSPEDLAVMEAWAAGNIGGQK